MRDRLSTENEVGLFGELLFLQYLVSRIGPTEALSSWQGPMSEEHDFVFPSLHLELKSTTSERRRHVIAGLSQMVPLKGTQLMVVSIQLTRSVPIAGETLSDLVDRTRHSLSGHGASFDELLVRRGWSLENWDLYPVRWVLRSTPRAYSVDSAFPAITPGLIAPVVPNFGLVSDVSYRVDLTELEFVELSDPFADFVEREEL